MLIVMYKVKLRHVFLALDLFLTFSVSLPLSALPASHLSGNNTTLATAVATNTRHFIYSDQANLLQVLRVADSCVSLLQLRLARIRLFLSTLWRPAWRSYKCLGYVAITHSLEDVE